MNSKLLKASVKASIKYQCLPQLKIQLKLQLKYQCMHRLTKGELTDQFSKLGPSSALDGGIP